MAGLLKRGLEEEGYAVDVAARARTPCGSATENPYDAIVLDLMLPDLDGFEVCRRLREARPVEPGAHAHRSRRRRRTASPGSTPAPTTT